MDSCPLFVIRCHVTVAAAATEAAHCSASSPTSDVQCSCMLQLLHSLQHAASLDAEAPTQHSLTHCSCAMPVTAQLPWKCISSDQTRMVCCMGGRLPLPLAASSNISDLTLLMFACKSRQAISGARHQQNIRSSAIACNEITLHRIC